MKYTIALILFVIGLVLAVITAFGYSKAKKAEGESFNAKPYAIKTAVVFTFFIIAQILLILNK